ncbi:MAG TPA: MFS transporter [Streptosporangiaceae bacterium]|nr:MFS transporter [Streptosporangiaceae bacterium]
MRDADRRQRTVIRAAAVGPAQAATNHQTAAPALGRGLICLLGIACAVGVGNVYFAQAVSPIIASRLHVTAASAALVVTATQFGYTAGIFLLVPLSDRFAHRRLIVTLLALTGFGLLAAAAAPGLSALIGATAFVGAATVVAPVIGAMAAGLAAADRRGVVSGTLLSGSIGGMLLSRVLGGVIAEHAGWRAPYLASAAVTLVLAVILARALPDTSPSSAQRYPALLAETVRLLRTEPELRRSTYYQAMVFAGFSAVWTAVAFLLTGPRYHMSTTAVGMLALVNAATMVCTPVAGRRVDRHGPDLVNLVCLPAVIAAAAVLALGTRGGPVGITALVAGTLLLDVAMQSGMVANQVRIYALGTEAGGRAKTAYMTGAYLAGGMGSWLGARAYALFGWPGVCGLTALLAGLALARHLTPASTAAAARAKPLTAQSEPSP